MIMICHFTIKVNLEIKKGMITLVTSDGNLVTFSLYRLEFLPFISDNLGSFQMKDKKIKLER